VSLDLKLRAQRAMAGAYRLDEEIGRGGMAAVFRAHDLRDGRAVAIKLLLPSVAEALGTERFLREVQLAGSLVHPNIVPVEATGEADGLPYYVMPLIDGRSLRDRLRPDQPLTIAEVVGYSSQVAAALDHAHVRGVVHRDIKPENLLLSTERLFVTDFGVGKALNIAGSSKLTATGFIVGTPAYMSPEQAAGDPDLDARSDLYSLGAVMYEMIGGAAPFVGRTVQQTMAMRFTQAPRPLGETRAGIPDGLVDLVRRLMAVAPAARVASAAAVGVELQTLSRSTA